MPVIKALTSTNIINTFSGTPDGTKFLRDDGTLVAAGGYTKLVASGTNDGTLTLYDDTAVTGVSTWVVRAGAGQSTTDPFIKIFANDGSTSIFTLATESGGAILTGTAFSQFRVGTASVWAADPKLASDRGITWANSTDYTTTADIGITRLSANVLKITDGSSGYGGTRAANMGIGVTPDTTSALKIKIAGTQTNAILLEGTGGIANPQIYWTDSSAVSGWLGFAGGDFILGDGGSGAAINIDPTYPNAYIKSYAGSTGFLTLQSHNGSAYVDALYMGAGKAILTAQQVQGTHSKTLTDNTITDVVQISSAVTDRVTAGHIAYTVYASDATTHKVQCETGKLPFLMVNENGTVTVTLGAVYGTAIDSAGGAALSNTFASSVSGTNAKIRITSDYDEATLTGTVTHAIEYRVHIDSGTATVTPQ